MSARDDFKQATKDLIAARVGYRCSNPRCRAFTSGPNSDPRKASNVGVAAHIAAAAPGGPRRAALAESDDRRAPENGIWLCQTCSRLVDVDPGRFPAETLGEWKTEAEALAERVLGVPAALFAGDRRPTVPTASLGLEWFALAHEAFAPVNDPHPDGNYAWLRGRAFGPFVYYTDGSPTPYRVGRVDGERLAAARAAVAGLVRDGLTGTTPLQYAPRAWSALYNAAPKIPSDRTGHLAAYAVELLEGAGVSAAEIEGVLAGWDVSTSTVVATLGILARTTRVAAPRFDRADETLVGYAGRLLAAVGAPPSQVDRAAATLSPAARRVLAAAARTLAVAHASPHQAPNGAPNGALPPFDVRLTDQWGLLLLGAWPGSTPGPGGEYAFTAWADDPAMREDPKRLYPLLRLIHRLGGGRDPLTPEAEDPEPHRARLGC